MRKLKDMFEPLLLWILIFITLIMGIILCSWTVKAKVLDTYDGKVWISEFVIEYWICKAPRRKLCKDPEERNRVARLFASASEKHKIPIILLVDQGYFESSLDWTVRGADDERGYLQVMPGGALDNDCDLETEVGGLDCGAKGLALCRKKCRNWYGALMQYKTGYCESEKIGVVSKIVYRLKWWMKLHKKISDIEKEIEAQKIQEEEMDAADVPEYLREENDTDRIWD